MGISSLVEVLVWARTHHVGLVGTSGTQEGMQVPVRSPGLGLGTVPEYGQALEQVQKDSPAQRREGDRYPGWVRAPGGISSWGWEMSSRARALGS